MALHSVTLASQTDLPGFRREARALLAALVPPEEAHWDARASLGLHRQRCGQGGADEKLPGGVNPLLPRSFLSLCNLVILHHDPARFELLYRLLWRLVHEPGLHRDPHDEDRLRALHMARAVRRDMQKMKSQVRFRTFRHTADGEPLQIAWFAPEHYIVEAVAPFFMRRMAHAQWAVLTPECCVRGRGESLEFGPGLRCERRLDRDAAEARWLGCYHQVFDADRAPGPLRSDRDSEPGQSFRPDSAP
jgi:DNA polymerase